MAVLKVPVVLLKSEEPTVRRVSDPWWPVKSADVLRRAVVIAAVFAQVFALGPLSALGGLRAAKAQSKRTRAG